MHRTLRLVPALVLLSAVSVSAAAETAPEPILSNVTTRTLPLVDDQLAQVASARLYVSKDAGATWTKTEELVVDPQINPRFTFTASGDGVYHLYSTVTYRDGTREGEPTAGTTAKLVLAVDTKAPAIASFSADVQQRSGAHLHVKLAWAVADENLDAQPITVEASLDGGASFAPLTKGGPTGSIVLPVALAQGTTAVHVRLAAQDRAANLAVSATQVLTVAAAPVVAEVAVVADPAPAPVATINPTPAPAVEPSPAPADAAALAAALAALPVVKPAPPIDPNRPDIVVPTPAPAVPVADVATVSNPGLEREWAEHQVRATPAAPGTDWQRGGRQPGAALAAVEPEAVPSAPTAAVTPGPKISVPAAPLPLVVEAAPALPPKPAILPAGVPPAGRLSPAQSDQVLAAAREAVSANDLTLASARYNRLRDSAHGELAVLEQVRAYRQAKQANQARSVIGALKPGERSDSIAIEEARCLLDLNRAMDAMNVLTGIPAHSPQSSEAFYVIAQTLQAQNRAPEAKKVLAHVATGSGPWADRARADLAR